jgi:hypothetical protein
MPPTGLPTTFRHPFEERSDARRTRRERGDARPGTAFRAAIFWIVGHDRAEDRSRLLSLSGGCLTLTLATMSRVYSIVLVALYIGDVITRPRTFRDLL